jgi:alginate O-acetyltransferase complex protein AlgI
VNFAELRFVAFFVAAFVVSWSLRGNLARKLWLLVCSYAFYAVWDERFLLLILGSTLVDYRVGLALGRSSEARVRKRWLVVSLVVNLGVLGVYKYFDFFIDSGAVLLDTLGLPASEWSLRLILPLGISFFTFQTMSYSIDVYRRQMEPTRNLLDLALFVGFFPQLVAGPIVRARSFLPQLLSLPRFEHVNVRACLMLFLVGFIKKAVVSDSLAPYVDAYFAAPASFDAFSAWLGVGLWSAQIYCDFSGYSDMAIGCAGLLGYNLCLNFDFPYFASSITQFWRRWHISLSSWLRDYLYIPLGGNRGGSWRTDRNLLLTMLLGGLWHGAAWTFVIWGGLHGLALLVHRSWRVRRPLSGRPSDLAMALGAAGTLYWVGLCWIFFRAQDLSSAWTVVDAYVLFDSPGTAVLGDRIGWVLLLLVVIHWVTYRQALKGWWERVPRWSFAIGYGAAAALCLSWIHPQSAPFIYFQF